MEQTELETLIGDVEVAIERLRSLYDQYFMGIEKIEPGVVRKDVDRRIYALRKEQIRNTALRFRFQMILQRYNTFQTHWQRVCREIENGTYKRHVLRAEQRFGKGATKKPSTAPPPPQAVAPSSRPRAKPMPGAPLPDYLAAELAELDKEFAPPPPQDDVLLAAARRNAAMFRAPLGAAKPAGAPPAPPTSVSPVRAEEGSRQGIRPRPGHPAARPPAAPPTSRPVEAPSVAPSPAQAALPRPAMPAPTLSSAPRSPLVPPRPTLPPLPRPPPAGSRAPGSPVSRPTVASKPAPPPPRPSIPATPLAPVKAPAAPTAAPATRDEGLSDVRVRQLYVEYVEARRRQNESTATITYDMVAQNLRDSSARLRERHGKPVDFEIAIRDGKAFLKPFLK